MNFRRCGARLIAVGREWRASARHNGSGLHPAVHRWQTSAAWPPIAARCCSSSTWPATATFRAAIRGSGSPVCEIPGAGLVVLAFPSDDFGKEEPDGNDEIKKFAGEKYKITFPLFAKISMAGEHMAPLYQFLTDKACRGRATRTSRPTPPPEDPSAGTSPNFWWIARAKSRSASSRHGSGDPELAAPLRRRWRYP